MKDIRANQRTSMCGWAMTANVAAVIRANAQDLGAAEALVRAFIDEAWNQGDFRNLSKQLAPVVTLHFGGRDIPLRTDDMIGFVQRFRNAFIVFRWAVDEPVAQGGTVAMRTTFSGTMTGPFDGHPANGHDMRVSLQLFAHVRDGHICELWEEYDVASALGRANARTSGVWGASPIA